MDDRAPVRQMPQRSHRVAAVVAGPNEGSDPLAGDGAKVRARAGCDLPRCALHEHLHREAHVLDGDPIGFGHLRGADCGYVAPDRKVRESHFRPRRISLCTLKLVAVTSKARTTAGLASRRRCRTASARSFGVCERAASSTWRVASIPTAARKAGATRRSV